MRQAARQLCGECPDEVVRRSILHFFNNLVRTGVLGFGSVRDLEGQGGANFGDECYVTPEGDKFFDECSRDPRNQQGYLNYLDQQATIDGVTRSYIEEALNTYCARCYKATAFLVGAAVENIVFDLRDDLVDLFEQRAEKVSSKLRSNKIKEATEGIAEKVIPDLNSECKKDAASKEPERSGRVSPYTNCSRISPIAQ
jgi:hypothetical protein